MGPTEDEGKASSTFTLTLPIRTTVGILILLAGSTIDAPGRNQGHGIYWLPLFVSAFASVVALWKWSPFRRENTGNAAHIDYKLLVEAAIVVLLMHLGVWFLTLPAIVLLIGQYPRYIGYSIESSFAALLRGITMAGFVPIVLALAHSLSRRVGLVSSILTVVIVTIFDVALCRALASLTEGQIGFVIRFGLLLLDLAVHIVLILLFLRFLGQRQSCWPVGKVAIRTPQFIGALTAAGATTLFTAIYILNTGVNDPLYLRHLIMYIGFYLVQFMDTDLLGYYFIAPLIGVPVALLLLALPGLVLGAILFTVRKPTPRSLWIILALAFSPIVASYLIPSDSRRRGGGHSIYSYQPPSRIRPPRPYLYNDFHTELTKPIQQNDTLLPKLCSVIGPLAPPGAAVTHESGDMQEAKQYNVALTSTLPGEALIDFYHTRLPRGVSIEWANEKYSEDALRIHGDPNSFRFESETELLEDGRSVRLTCNSNEKVVRIEVTARDNATSPSSVYPHIVIPQFPPGTSVEVEPRFQDYMRQVTQFHGDLEQMIPSKFGALIYPQSEVEGFEFSFKNELLPCVTLITSDTLSAINAYYEEKCGIDLPSFGVWRRFSECECNGRRFVRFRQRGAQTLIRLYTGLRSPDSWRYGRNETPEALDECSTSTVTAAQQLTPAGVL